MVVEHVNITLDTFFDVQIFFDLIPGKSWIIFYYILNYFHKKERIRAICAD